MRITGTRTLVNFRADTDVLKAFDNACSLASRTRTQTLNDLMRGFTVKAASKMPKQIAEEKRSYKALRAAVERAYERHRADGSKSGQSPFRTRPRKGFAEFIADDPIVGKNR